MNPAPQPAENPPALLCEPPAQTPAPVLRRVSAPVRFATRLTRLSAHALRGQRIVRQLFPQLDA
ncbi:MAG: 1-acyl-sn-glycerol-3-phosphate acyltransferase, partial [Thiomonas sp. 14-64-326]